MYIRHMCIHICVCVCIYIYIYICVCVCVCVYIQCLIYISDGGEDTLCVALGGRCNKKKKKRHVDDEDG